MRSHVELGLVKSQPKPKSILDLIKISQPQPSSHFFRLGSIWVELNSPMLQPYV